MMNRPFVIPNFVETDVPRPGFYQIFRIYMNGVTEEEALEAFTPIVNSRLRMTYAIVGTDSPEESPRRNYIGIVAFRMFVRLNTAGRVRGVQQLHPTVNWAPSVYVDRDIENIRCCRDFNESGSVPIEH